MDEKAQNRLETYREEASELLGSLTIQELGGDRYRLLNESGVRLDSAALEELGESLEVAKRRVFVSKVTTVTREATLPSILRSAESQSHALDEVQMILSTFLAGAMVIAKQTS